MNRQHRTPFMIGKRTEGEGRMNRKLLGMVSALVAGLSLMGAAPAVYAHSTDGELFYTTFFGDADRVFRRTYAFDGGATLTYGVESAVSSIGKGLGGADGIVFDATDTSFLLFGGQDRHVHRVKISDGSVTPSGLTTGSDFHLVIDPAGSHVLGTGIPGSTIAEVALSPFGAVSTLAIAGADDTSITGLAFDPSTPALAYYTSSGPAGTGSFGTATKSGGTVTTTRLASGVPAAHGIVFDPFSSSLILFGDGSVSQYKPGTGFISTFTPVGPNQFDQGAIDGKGHLFGASNDGDMLFIDYSGTGKVGGTDGLGAGNFSDLRFFKDSLDDLAPLTGKGSRPPVVPEPTSMLLFGLGGIGTGLVNRRKQSKA